MAGRHPRGGAADDAVRRAGRRAARGGPTRIGLALADSRDRRNPVGAHRQQPDERSVRHPDRPRQRNLSACPLRAAPGALGAGQPSHPARRDRSGEPGRPGDPDRADLGARLAGGGVRAVGLRAQLRLHRTAAATEEARPRRAGRAGGLGPADGLRHLLLRGRPRRLAGAAGVAALRPALHDRVDGQAHRQDPLRRAARHPHAAGALRRSAGPAR